MATNEKWIPPPYRGGQTEATENQTSDTIAAQNIGDINALDDLPASNNGEDGSGDLRIVLIGKTGTGKSATGNTLVGEDVFQFRGSSKSVTTKCTVVQKRRFGKTLVAVDTPGFLETYMSSERLREELVSCTCFTYPGVHAFLLVFQVGQRYIDEDQRAIESMKELFCEKFVNHTVVVFTGQDTLDADKETLKDYISELPEKLREMIASCKGGVIAISNRGQHYEREQAAKNIISKVEEVVRRNGGEGQYYSTLLSVEISKMIAENIKEILKANVKVYDKIRLIKQEMERLSGEDSRIKEKREEFEEIIDGLKKKLIDEDGLCDLRIVLVGTTGTGKSATGNTLIGSEKRVFKSSASRTSVTTECSVAEIERFGNKLVVVDTPGVLDTTMTEHELKIQLMECTYLACPGVHAFLFLVKIGQRDMANKDTKAFHMIKNLLGEEFLSHAIVVFTGKETLDEDGDDVEEYLSKLPDESKTFIKSCKGGVVAISNASWNAEKKTAAKQIIDKVEKLVKQNGGRNNYYKNALFDEKNKEINQRMEQILNENHKIQNMINKYKEKLELFKRNIKDGKPTTKQYKQQQTLERQIDDLRKALVERKNLRFVDNDKIKYEQRKATLARVAKVAGGVAVCAGVVALGPKAVVAGVLATVAQLQNELC